MNNWINTAQGVGSLWAIVMGLCQMSVSEQQYSVLLLVSPSSEPSIVWTVTKRTWLCLISYFSTNLFLFLSFCLVSLPSFSWSMDWSAVFGKTMLRHINPLEYFSFSLCCPFFWIWEWNRTLNWSFLLSAVSQSSTFLVMVSIWPLHLDFSPRGTKSWREADVYVSPVWKVDEDGVWEFESGYGIHSSDVVRWSKLWLQQEKLHHSCQEAPSPHFIVVPWFGGPLCHCTMDLARLRTSQLN